MFCYLNRYLKMSNITFKLLCYCYCCKTYANMKSVSKVCTNHSSSIKKIVYSVGCHAAKITSSIKQ